MLHVPVHSMNNKHCRQMPGSNLFVNNFCYRYVHGRAARCSRLQCAANCSALREQTAWSGPIAGKESLQKHPGGIGHGTSIISMSSIIELSLYMQRFGHIFCGLRFVWARQFSLECPPLSLFGFCCLLLCWSSDYWTHFALDSKEFPDILCVTVVDLKLWGSTYREGFNSVLLSFSRHILEFAT